MLNEQGPTFPSWVAQSVIFYRENATKLLSVRMQTAVLLCEDRIPVHQHLYARVRATTSAAVYGTIYSRQSRTPNSAEFAQSEKSGALVFWT